MNECLTPENINAAVESLKLRMPKRMRSAKRTTAADQTTQDKPQTTPKNVLQSMDVEYKNKIVEELGYIIKSGDETIGIVIPNGIGTRFKSVWLNGAKVSEHGDFYFEYGTKNAAEQGVRALDQSFKGHQS